MTWKSNSFIFQVPLKALSGKRGDYWESLGIAGSCQILRSVVATSCDCSCKVFLVHKVSRAQCLSADDSVWRRESLLKTCTVPPENTSKFLLLPALIPVVHCSEFFSSLLWAVLG